MVKPPKRKPIPMSVKREVVRLAAPWRRARGALEEKFPIDFALRLLGYDPKQVDWSHEPALGLRAYNKHDYDPPQHDPHYINIRSRAEHKHITFKDNGTGRSDATSIARTRKVTRKHQEHLARMAAKQAGKPMPEPAKRKQKIKSRGFEKKQRPLRGRSGSLRKRGNTWGKYHASTATKGRSLQDRR